MIRTSPAAYYRAAGAVLAAAFLTTTAHRAAAQTIDLFAGSYGSTPSLAVTSTLISTGVSNSNSFGPGYSGTVSLGAGAVDTLTEGFATLGASNSFSINETGVATLGGTTTAAKLLGVSLTPTSTYTLTLTRTAGFTVGLLGSVNILLSANGTTFLNTSTGQGLANIVDVLSLFGTSNTASFTFTVPPSAVGTLGVNINSTLPVAALSGGYTFTAGTINQVPEPRTTWAMLLGAGGLTVLRFRRRLRAAL